MSDQLWQLKDIHTKIIIEWMFITFEGGEGSGKSVQSKLLAKKLQANGYDVVLTREPGGTEGAESIRGLVLKGDVDRWSPLTESLLYLAARADHWQRVIQPALEAGKIVISDRFQDSTIVYQGYCKGVPIHFLNTVYEQITHGIYPDRTYFLSVDPKIGLTRSVTRRNNDEIRFEKMDLSFHEDVLQYFLQIAMKNQRFLIVNGNNSIQCVENEIYEDFCKFRKSN